jgi:hypothetical protein
MSATSERLTDGLHNCVASSTFKPADGHDVRAWTSHSGRLVPSHGPAYPCEPGLLPGCRRGRDGVFGLDEHGRERLGT